MNTEQNRPIGEDAIGAKDVCSIARLLGDIAQLSDPLDQKRRPLIAGLAELIEADAWLWTLGRVDPKRKIPMQLEMLFDGLTDPQLAALLDSPSDTTISSPCDQPLAALVAQGEHFVRTRQQLVDDDVWYNNANTKTYFLRHGIDQCMYAITPLEGEGFSGIGFFRRTGRPAFTEQQRQIVEVVTSEVRWLYESSLTERMGSAVAKLTPRLRSVLPLLLDGYLCKEIAKLFHLSPHTVKGYIRDIYRHFDVKSQLSLIRYFQGGTPKNK